MDQIRESKCNHFTEMKGTEHWVLSTNYNIYWYLESIMLYYEVILQSYKFQGVVELLECDHSNERF